MTTTAFRRDALGDWIFADPDSDLDYGIALKDWLATGETIASAVWTVPVGVTKHDEFINVTPIVDACGVTHPAGTVALVFLRPSAAVVGQDYEIRCRFTTTSTPPRVDDRSFRLRIAQR